MEDPTRTVMDELARTSGVVGVERLAALFTRREPEAANTGARVPESLPPEQAKGKASPLLIISGVVFSSDEEARSVIESCS